MNLTLTVPTVGQGKYENDEYSLEGCAARCPITSVDSPAACAPNTGCCVGFHFNPKPTDGFKPCYTYNRLEYNMEMGIGNGWIACMTAAKPCPAGFARSVMNHEDADAVAAKDAWQNISTCAADCAADAACSIFEYSMVPTEGLANCYKSKKAPNYVSRQAPTWTTCVKETLMPPISRSSSSVP